MRWQLLSVVLAASLVSLAGYARADGYEAPTAAAPVMLQVSNWTGFYANGGVGYGLWDAQTTTDVVGGSCIGCARVDQGGRGWLGEIGLGYDTQVTDKIVIGALFNYAFSDMKGTVSDNVGFTGRTNNDSTWFVGARAGWLMTPDVLNYWSAGYTHTHFGGATLDLVTGTPFGAHLDSYDAGGWFLGGGLEVAMHGGWFWRSEVRYADYSKQARSETLPGGGAAFVNLNFDPVVETATSEIVYKFNWPN
jgi:outer membrane immunogenic protein